jgi:hypothetical protein
MPAATRGTGAARGAEICGLAQTLPSISIGAKRARLYIQAPILSYAGATCWQKDGQCRILHTTRTHVSDRPWGDRSSRSRNWTRTRLYLISDKIVSAVTLRSACRAVRHVGHGRILNTQTNEPEKEGPRPQRSLRTTRLSPRIY